MEIIDRTLYIFSPHQLAENVYGLINRQSVLSIIIMGITLAIASRKNYNFKRKAIPTTVMGSSLVCIPYR